MGTRVSGGRVSSARASGARVSGGRRSGARGAPPRHGLADALFTDTQQRVLGLLFGQPERSFMQTEVIRLARSGSGAVQRELERLAASGIITVTTVAGRKFLQANAASPVYEDLRGIVEKTTGVAAELRRVLESAGDRVRFAILFGSMAKGTDASKSDIDVLLVSDDLTQEEAFAWFKASEKRLGRRVSPTIYTSREWTQRRQEGNPFLTKVLAGKYVVLTGSEDAISA